MANTNYDPDELKKFTALANHWWDELGALRTLHQINPLRMQFITQQCLIVDKKVLDIGCGGGILSESLALAQANVSGIDLDQAVIAVAKQHQVLTQVKIDYRCIAAETLAEERPGYFDLITCMEMLEHVPDPQSIVKACATLLKPGGHVFFSTLNRNVKSYLFSVIGAEYIFNLLPKGTHDYGKFIKPSELKSWLSAANLQIQHIRGISYRPLQREFVLSDDVSVNYLIHAVKP